MAPTPDIRWTPEQRQAIETVGRNVFVTAAAGSGKTAVLAERCAYLVCDAPVEARCGVDQLLVVTFTEAAAGEMRGRIRQSLARRLAGRPNDAHLRMQTALLDSAQISTIHAFCLWLLRRWFNEVGLDPAANVLDADETRILKSTVLEKVMQDRYDDKTSGEAFRSLVDTYGLGRDAPIARFATRLSDLLDSLPDPIAWLADARERLSSSSGELIRGDLEALRQEIAFHLELTAHAAQGIGGQDRGCAFYRDLLRAHADQLTRWLHELGAPVAGDTAGTPRDRARVSLDEIKSQMRSYRLSARSAPRAGKEAGDADRAAREAVKQPFEYVRRLFENRVQESLARFTTEELERDLETIAPHAAALVDLIGSFRSAYGDAKRRMEVLDFADLERFAFEALRRPDVADAVRRRFAYVLVDEYQDVNRLQAEILRRASREDDPAAAPNLFAVGDVKQSIYRFRSAEPRAFLERLNACEANPKRGQAVRLRDNFRSRPTVLQAVNELFCRLMRPTVGDVDYGPEEALRPGRTFDEPGPFHTTVDVHLLDRKVAPPDEEKSEAPEFVDPNDPAEWQAAEREAFVIAREIERLREGDMRVDGGRPVELGDIAVLLRAPAYIGDVMARFLTRCGIEAHSLKRGTMFDTTEIRDLRALLDVLDNPQQDIPLAALLRSPLLGNPLNENDLLAVRRLDRDIPFHEAVRRYGREGADAGLRSRLERILDRLERYRRSMREQPVPEALWHLIENTGYLAYVGGLNGGEQRRANLLRFFERARGFSRFKQQGLRRFLRFIDALEEQDEDFGAAPSVAPSADAVRIMSIHAAKGLEFPIVFVAALGRAFNLSDARGRLIFDRDRGIGLNVIDREKMIEYPSAAHRQVSSAVELATRGEELRILYVALTRARERLVLVGSLPMGGVEQSRRTDLPSTIPALSIATARCPLDWLIPALRALPADKVAWSGERGAGALFGVHLHDGASMAAWRLAPTDGTEATPLFEAVSQLRELPPDEPVALDERHADRIFNRVHFDYPYLAASSVRAVWAASEVKNLPDSLRNPEEHPREMFQPADATPRERTVQHDFDEGRRRGLATHKFLQHLDFATAGDLESVRIQCERVVAAGRLTPQEADLIDIEAVAWFVSTPLAETIRRVGPAYRREFMFVAEHPAQWVDETLPGDLEEHVMVRGIVDGVIPTDGGLEIVDFKTDRVDAADVTRLAEHYRPQMTLYAASLAPIFQKPVTHCRLVFLHPRVIVSDDGQDKLDRWATGASNTVHPER